MLNSDQQTGFPISTFTLTYAEMQGRNAAKGGELMRTNPYPKESEEHHSWNESWKAQQRQRSRRMVEEAQED